MIRETESGGVIIDTPDDLEAFFSALAEDGPVDPDALSSEAWEDFDTAFEWLAGRVWMYWWIEFYPEMKRVRIYMEPAGPEMRAHP